MASTCAAAKPLCEEQKPSNSEVCKPQAATKSPWNCSVAEHVSVTSLEDVMSEQLAVELQLDDEMKSAKANQSIYHMLDHTGGFS